MKRKTATARKQRSPANIENGGKNSRRQPPAELNRTAQNGKGISVPTAWNRKTGISRKVSGCSGKCRACHLHLNKSNKIFCLIGKRWRSWLFICSALLQLILIVNTRPNDFRDKLKSTWELVLPVLRLCWETKIRYKYHCKFEKFQNAVRSFPYVLQRWNFLLLTKENFSPLYVTKRYCYSLYVYKYLYENCFSHLHKSP